LRRSTDLVRVCAFRIGQLYEHPCEYLPSCGLDSSGGTADFVSRRCFSVICCSSPHHLTLQAREVAHCIFIAALGSCIGTHATRRGASLAIEASELVLRRGRQNGCAGQKVGDDLATLVVDAETVVVDAELSLHGSGPVWGAESDDLNATLLVWSAGTGPPEHVNDERDVLFVVLAGSLELRVDGEETELIEDETVIVAKGRLRKITAGPAGVRYLSVHLRRPPLQIGPRGG
jgi:quercetin dioxygenase-like cupin family protein